MAGGLYFNPAAVSLIKPLQNSSCLSGLKAYHTREGQARTGDLEGLKG